MSSIITSQFINNITLARNELKGHEITLLSVKNAIEVISCKFFLFAPLVWKVRVTNSLIFAYNADLQVWKIRCYKRF